jgi:hypothetical protein
MHAPSAHRKRHGRTPRSQAHARCWCPCVCLGPAGAYVCLSRCPKDPAASGIHPEDGLTPGLPASIEARLTAAHRLDLTPPHLDGFHWPLPVLGLVNSGMPWWIGASWTTRQAGLCYHLRRGPRSVLQRGGDSFFLP